VAAHRTHDTAFTRQRVLTFPALVAFLLCAFKGGLQTRLDELFSALQGGTVRTVTKGAVSQARQKLKASVFEALTDRLLRSLATLMPEPRWRGLRLVATDSTTLRLPPWLENQAEFGVQYDASGQPYVLARALGLFATTSRLMLKAVIGRFDDAERALLVQLVPHLAEDDLLIMDRGFPALWLFAWLHQRGVPGLARLDGTQWPDVEAFLRSGQSETVLARPLTSAMRRQAQAAGVELFGQTVRLRLIQVLLPNGSIQVLATSLTDTTAFPAQDFAELYHARWGIEEAFKLLKHRLMVEQFTGELPESIRQDFHAKVFTANLAQALAASAHDSLPEDKAARYFPNVTSILDSLKNRLFCWLIQRVPPAEVLTLLELYAKTLELKRPGRTAPRPKSRLNPKPRRQYK
jgi:hypothetical protein